MLLLDTDILTIVQIGRGEAYAQLVRRIEHLDTDVATTIVSFEEQLRGWLGLISKAKQSERQLLAYHRLMELLLDFRDRKVVPFDREAQAVYERIRASHRRLGAMDLKIAAIAMANDATLATRNVADFKDIKGLALVDPTKGA